MVMIPAKDRAATYRAKQLAKYTAMAKRVEELEEALTKLSDTVLAEEWESFWTGNYDHGDRINYWRDLCIGRANIAKQALEGSAKP